MLRCGKQELDRKLLEMCAPEVWEENVVFEEDVLDGTPGVPIVGHLIALCVRFFEDRRRR